MTWTLVGHDSTGFNDGNGGHVYSPPSGAPSAGDLDILTVNSDTTVSTPSGFTLPTNGSTVGGQGAYVFYRIAAGGEGSTITVATNGNFNTALTWSRWRGATGFDRAANTAVDGSAGTSSPAVSTGSLASGNELVLMVAALHSTTSPASPAWSTGYTGLDSVVQGAGGGGCAAFTGYRTDAGPGSESPSVSWTNNAGDRYAITIAFTPSSAVLTRTTSDSVTVSDALSRTTVLARSVSETVAVTDSVTRTSTAARATTDTVTITDVAVGSTLRDLILSVQPPTLKWQVGRPTVAVISAASLEYVRARTSATANGSAVNPTTDTVKMAFLSSQTGTPSSGDWLTASWDTDTSTGRYYAQCLIGPGGGQVTLTSGTWWVWVKVTDSPEVLIRPAGWLVVT